MSVTNGSSGRRVGRRGARPRPPVLGWVDCRAHRRRARPGHHRTDRPAGQREFSYARSASVGSSLGPDDFALGVMEQAGAVIGCTSSGTRRTSPPHLWTTIERAMADSDWLILMASPKAAESP